MLHSLIRSVASGQLVPARVPRRLQVMALTLYFTKAVTEEIITPRAMFKELMSIFFQKLLPILEPFIRVMDFFY